MVSKTSRPAEERGEWVGTEPPGMLFQSAVRARFRQVFICVVKPAKVLTVVPSTLRFLRANIPAAEVRGVGGFQRACGRDFAIHVAVGGAVGNRNACVRARQPRATHAVLNVESDIRGHGQHNVAGDAEHVDSA